MCLWISLLIHITVVLLLPAPSTVEASSTVAVHFAGAPPIEPEILPPEEAATEEAATEEDPRAALRQFPAWSQNHT